MGSDASKSLGSIRPFFRIGRLMGNCNTEMYMQRETLEGNADKNKETKPNKVNITHRKQKATNKRQDILLLPRQKKKNTQHMDAVHKCANAVTESKMEEGMPLSCAS